MPFFAVYQQTTDLCGSTELIGPLVYVEANTIVDVEEVFPYGSFVGHYIEEIKIENISWLKIQHQLGVNK
jgi:hypothetical protein